MRESGRSERRASGEAVLSSVAPCPPVAEAGRTKDGYPHVHHVSSANSRRNCGFPFVKLTVEATSR